MVSGIVKLRYMVGACVYHRYGVEFSSARNIYCWIDPYIGDIKENGKIVIWDQTDRQTDRHNPSGSKMGDEGLSLLLS